MTTFIGAELSQKIDDELMGEDWGFASEQLMELAGLAVASAVAKEFPPCSVLIICGPGNNGGDGLIVARHLKLWGYEAAIYYPKQRPNSKFQALLKQSLMSGATLLDSLPDLSNTDTYQLVVDAVFGYSFKGDLRAPFDTVIPALGAAKIPVLSVDIPSGWDVEKGDVNGSGLLPKVLVSLTAPKLCAKEFKGVHYLGGRFIAPEFAKKYGLEFPAYSGGEQIVKLESHL
eukprot:TRINITY_DN14401_c0_g1_i1.p1 TRINITY_DN14401_c0_g1~~TRINITY_DN14401_c0_g1_i1.p1  ORF type:complete len:230 (-),score=32.78 TRINITY_DN14401_c0_g1_i1:62-751(-)